MATKPQPPRKPRAPRRPRHMFPFRIVTPPEAPHGPYVEFGDFGWYDAPEVRRFTKRLNEMADWLEAPARKAKR